MVGLESSAKPLAPIFGLTIVSLLALFVLDASAFRTPWYGQHVEPESYAGSFEGVLRNEKTRDLPATNRALVLGDSSIAEGFSAQLANSSVGRGSWFFSNASNPGATPRTWFYLIRDLDPSAHRYNVIVLPLIDYVDADGIYTPDIDKEADRDIDLNRLAVRLRLTDALTFPFSYLNYEKKLWAWRGTIFKGLIYRRDFREFLRDPRHRIEKVQLFRDHLRGWLDAYRGNPGSLAGLRYDVSTNRLTFPPGLSKPLQKILIDRYQPERLSVQGYRRAYRKRWLDRIVAHYRNSGATIVFFRVPERPIPLRVSIPQNGTTFLEKEAGNPAVVVLDKAAFSDLESPATFFDPYHMNASGRAEFSPRLAQAVIAAVNRKREPRR